MKQAERQQEIMQVFAAAIECEPSRRAAFLAEHCNDEELRHEVEKLLASYEELDSFLGQPVLMQEADHLNAALTRPEQERKLGRYQLLSLLGEGGMGQVFRALDVQLHRHVAVKVLPEHLTHNSDALSRFKREAQVLAALSHPNILTIYDVGEEQGVHYVVTELLTGETLRERMPLTADEVFSIALAIAEGLAAAHAKGITHRDLKPENVFLTNEGGVKILDFGLAQFDRGALCKVDEEYSTITQLTVPGLVMGTVPYMSPEQVRGQTMDTRSDIFSFGSLLYEMVSGKRPFSRSVVAETTGAILFEPPPPLAPPAQATVSPPLQQVIWRCLEKQREDRYSSGHELTAALRAAISPQRSRAALWMGGGLLLVVALLLVGMWWDGRQTANASLPVATAQTTTAAPVEVLTYYLEQDASAKSAQHQNRRLTGKSYRFHLVPREAGHLYVIAPGENNVPTLLLVDQLTAGTDYSFPAKNDEWILVTDDDPVTTFTIIFSPVPVTPGFAQSAVGQSLTPAAQQALEQMRRASGRPAMEPPPNARMPVTRPADSDARAPLLFEVSIKGK